MNDRRGDLRAAISEAQKELISTIDSFQGNDWQLLSPNEGWTAKDTLAHLCSIEERQRNRVHAILAGTPFTTEAVDDYNDRKLAERRDWTVEQLREELATERGLTIQLLEGVREEDLDRFIDDPRRGPMSVERVYQSIASHMRTHTADIAASRGTQR